MITTKDNSNPILKDKNLMSVLETMYQELGDKPDPKTFEVAINLVNSYLGSRYHFLIDDLKESLNKKWGPDLDRDEAIDFFESLKSKRRRDNLIAAYNSLCKKR